MYPMKDIRVLALYIWIVGYNDSWQKEHVIVMAPKLYMLPASPAVRSVLMCAKALGLDLDLKTVNLMNGEHLTPEFLKVN